MTSIESTEHKTRERNESTGSNVSGSSAGLCLSFTPDLVSIGDPEDELTAQRTESFEDYFKAHTFGGAAYDNTQTKSAYRLTLGMLYLSINVVLVHFSELSFGNVGLLFHMHFGRTEAWPLFGRERTLEYARVLKLEYNATDFHAGE